MRDERDREFFLSKRADRTYVSRPFGAGAKLRYHSKVVDGEPGLAFATKEDEVILRTTKGGRYEIRATVFEDERQIQSLTIQRFNATGGPHEHVYFTFHGEEITTLLSFVAGIKTMPLEGETKVRLSDEQLREIVLNHGLARAMFAKDPELFMQLAESEDLTRDIIAVGYRRKQLEYFELLMKDPDTSESEWQTFFERNTWIFGYGLFYQFLSSLDLKKLEQVVSGHDLSGPGKRADAVMKTRGQISSLCFVEIKGPRALLVGPRPYRAGVWAPSSELVSGVAQVQATVQAAMDRLSPRLVPRDAVGDPTDEVLFNIQPRSCLVIGNLSEFEREQGINEAQYRSFELYRRNTWRPEILTFDELLQRARFIVEHAEQPEDDVPF